MNDKHGKMTMTAGLKIYGIARSRAFKTIWCAEELGVPYEQVQISFNDGTNKTGDFLKINPNGRVPAIVDGGFPLFESMAINLYLAKKYGEGGMYPASPQNEALTWQWTFWSANELERLMGEWGYNTIVLPEKERDPKKAADALAALQQPLAVLDAHLAKQTWMLPVDRFTVADLNIASTMMRAFQSMELSARPNVMRWLKACYARPAAITAIKRREA